MTSTRFADAMKNGIKGSELAIFETCAHAPIYESVAEFNEKTWRFSNAMRLAVLSFGRRRKRVARRPRA